MRQPYLKTLPPDEKSCDWCETDCIGRLSADYCRGVGLQSPAWANAKLHKWIKELQKVHLKLQLCEFKTPPSVSTDCFLILISLSQTVEASLFCWYSERGCSFCLTLDLNYEHHFCCLYEQNEWLQQVSGLKLPRKYMLSRTFFLTFTNPTPRVK